jgi:PTS system ascorbate-specific IIA component
MIGLLILAQQEIGIGLIRAAEHVLGQRPDGLDALPVNYDQPPEQLAQRIQQYLDRLDEGHGVLILADIYGATHTNAACRLLRKGRIELVAGVNLPMLIRVLNYRDHDLTALVHKAMTAEGIVCASAPGAAAEGGR